MKMMNVVRKYGSKIAAGATLAVVSAQSFAAATPIDTAEPVAQLAEGKTSAVAIGVAVLAFVVLIGVLVKLRRTA